MMWRYDKVVRQRTSDATSLPIGCLYSNWYCIPEFVLSITNYIKKWLLLTEIYLELTFSIYCRSFSDIVQLSVTGWRHLHFHQLPLLRQGILLNYSHCCLIAVYAFHPDSFLLENKFCLGYYISILSFSRKHSGI
jgi:hypothetical protein